VNDDEPSLLLNCNNFQRSPGVIVATIEQPIVQLSICRRAHDHERDRTDLEDSGCAYFVPACRLGEIDTHQFSFV